MRRAGVSVPLNPASLRQIEAEVEAKIAVSLNPSPDYQELLTKIQSAAVSK